MNYVEAANLSSHPIFLSLSLGSACRRSCLQAKSVSKSRLCLGFFRQPSLLSFNCLPSCYLHDGMPCYYCASGWARNNFRQKLPSAFNGLYSKQQNNNTNPRYTEQCAYDENEKWKRLLETSYTLASLIRVAASVKLWCKATLYITLLPSGTPPNQSWQNLPHQRKTQRQGILSRMHLFSLAHLLWHIGAILRGAH